jgi:predicted glutamine amidotransferase
MCGICGVHKFGDAPIRQDMIDLLLLNNQTRGLDATGVALHQADGSIDICKDNVTAYEFIIGHEYNDFMKDCLKKDTVTVIGHTRKATTGTPRVIANNHPMSAGKVAVVHNGHIHDWEQKFRDWKLDKAPQCETDSDIIRAVLDKEGFTRKAVDKLSQLSGNAAFAAISPDYPGKLLLARSGNPLELAATSDFLMFSSEKGPIYKAMRPFCRVWGIMMREMTPINYYMIGMDNDSAWLFSEHPREGNADWTADWLEWHTPMKIARNYTAPVYACHAQFHGNRVKFYDDRPVDVVQCPNLKCGQYLNVSPAILKDLAKYRCGVCNTKLG